MLRPTYSLVIDGTTISSDTLKPLVALDVRRGKSSGADSALIALGQVPPIAPEVGGDVALELGWDGETTLVFTGLIERTTSANTVCATRAHNRMANRN